MRVQTLFLYKQPFKLFTKSYVVYHSLLAYINKYKAEAGIRIRLNNFSFDHREMSEPFLHSRLICANRIRQTQEPVQYPFL